MRKLFLVLALLILGSFMSQGAFAATAAPNTYPACYHGYGVGDPLYNGTNGDQLTEPGWCIDGYGVLQPNNIMTKSSTQPVTQGGFAVPIINFNYSTTLNAGPTPSTFDALIPQQTGSIIVDYGAQPITPVTIDTLKGTGAHYMLPPAMPGEIFTIISASQSVITVDTLTPGFATTEGLTYPNSDIIEWSPAATGMTAGQAIKSPGNAGDSVTLVCPLAGIWVVKDMLGQLGGIATSDSLWTVSSVQ